VRRKRFLCLFVILALAAAGMSSCRITWGGRGTLNSVTDRTLERAVVQVSDPSTRGN
jgi:hypothetical protein